MRRPKIKLSSELETHFFKKRLSANEVQNLKKLCEHYQKGMPSRTGDWLKISKEAYHQYFGFQAALKTKRVFEDLENLNYLCGFQNKTPRLIDFGAGTLGSLLGAVDYLRSKNIKIEQATVIDRQSDPLEWSKQNFKDYLPDQIDLQADALGFSELQNSIILATDVFNEMKLFHEKGDLLIQSNGIRLIEAWLRKMDETSLLVIMTPAVREWNTQFLKLRDYYAEQKKILLPCPHLKKCPALLANEWCHEDRLYSAPQKYWSLVDQLGFRRPSLQYSLLVLGHQPNTYSSHQARVVSNPLEGKGKSERWLCAKGKRWKASLLERNKSDAAMPFHQSERGDVVELFEPIQPPSDTLS